MARAIKESVLFRTSLASDWQVSGGVINIPGLSPVSKKDIAYIIQTKSRAEVLQVVTVGGTAYTPTANTPYKVAVFDQNRRYAAYQEQPKVYTFQLATITGVAATDREAISVGLVAAINADSTNHAIAATLGGGAGFTVTDEGPYYPVRSQTMTNILGVNEVYTIENPDGSGFVGPTTALPLGNAAITTAAVLSSGIGAIVLQQKVVVDLMFGGNLISGDLEDQALTTTGLPAVSGQNYDIFSIISLKALSIPTVTDFYGYVYRTQNIYVDNGTGAVTTNLAGFVAFEKEAIRSITDLFEGDPIAQFDFFDNALIASATYPTTGAAITTTDNVVMAAKSSGQKFDWYINPIGTHTLLTPIVAAGGLQTFLDAITQEGIELSVPNLTQNPKQFVVGKTAASFYARFNIGTGVAATSYKSLSIGFRKKAAYAVDQTAYEAASVATAAIGIPLDTGVAPVWNTITGPGSAGALTNTSTTVTATVSTAFDIFITVDINGSARFYLNGVDRTPAAGYTFTAGLVLMPFVSFRHGAAADAVPLLIQAAFLPSITWRG